MLPIPPLTDQESARLRASIQRDGIIYPVLLNGAGKVIDGNHRKQIAAELGITHLYDGSPLFKTLDVDEGTFQRFAVALNLARRQLIIADQYDMIAWLDEQYREEAEEEARQRRTAGAAAGGRARSVPNGHTPSSVPPKQRSADTVVGRINADLGAAGEKTGTISSRTLNRARVWKDLPAKEKAEVRAGRKSMREAVEPKAKKAAKKAPPTKSDKPVVKDKLQQNREQEAQIRLFNAQKQYESMHNAPRGKLNLPLVRRAQNIQEQLDDVFEIVPDDAVLAYGPELCRVFTVSRAEWWLRFCQLNEKRWQEEVPHLPPMVGKRMLPLAERDLTSTERAILDWLRKQTTADTPLEAAMSATEAAVAVRGSLSVARTSLNKLATNGLAEVVGQIDGHKMYVAT